MSVRESVLEDHRDFCSRLIVSEMVPETEAVARDDWERSRVVHSWVRYPGAAVARWDWGRSKVVLSRVRHPGAMVMTVAVVARGWNSVCLATRLRIGKMGTPSSGRRGLFEGWQRGKGDGGWLRSWIQGRRESKGGDVKGSCLEGKRVVWARWVRPALFVVGSVKVVGGRE